MQILCVNYINTVKVLAQFLSARAQIQQPIYDIIPAFPSSVSVRSAEYLTVMS